MIEFNMEKEVLKATDEYFLKHFGCAKCKGVRFKTCEVCGQGVNSFHDHREYQREGASYRKVEREKPFGGVMTEYIREK